MKDGPGQQEDKAAESVENAGCKMKKGTKMGGGLLPQLNRLSNAFDVVHGESFGLMEQKLWGRFQESEVFKAWEGKIIERIRARSNEKHDFH